MLFCHLNLLAAGFVDYMGVCRFSLGDLFLGCRCCLEMGELPAARAPQFPVLLVFSFGLASLLALGLTFEETATRCLAVLFFWVCGRPLILILRGSVIV
jgi:hypothetical protein